MHEKNATGIDASEDFAWNLPSTFNFGRDVVDAIAKAEPDKLALIWCDDAGNEQRFSFGDISRRTNQFAALLVAQGVKRGDRVMVMLPRLPQWQIAMVGCLKLGAIPIPCIDMLTEKDILYRVTKAKAVAAITTSASVPKFSSSTDLRVRIAVGGDGSPGWLDFDQVLDAQPTNFTCDDTGLDDPAVIYFTSGSTGLPKGVTQTSRGLYCWRVSAEYWHDLKPTDLMWCTADTGWSKAGTGILFGPWSQGSAVLFYNGKFNAAERLKLIARYGVTIFCGATTEFRHLINEDFSGVNLSRLRLATSAGETVNPEVIRRWQEITAIPLLEAYGQTETLMTTANCLNQPTKAGSMGRALPGSKFAVLDPEGQIVPFGERGQLSLVLPNPQLMLGYWDESERTANAMLTRNGISYFLTGDLAHMDAEGYIFYEGRVDDIISSAGYRIGPTEVENALQEHPAVTECAVVASPDPERGEIVKAFVVLRQGYQPSDALALELQEHVKKSTAPYKYPRAIEFRDELPKTPTGKLLRRLLKDAEFARVKS